MMEKIPKEHVEEDNESKNVINEECIHVLHVCVHMFTCCM